MSDLITVEIPLGERSYNVVIGPEALMTVSPLVAEMMQRGRAIIVTDEIVAHHHLAGVKALLTAQGLTVETITMPAGETSKSFAGLEGVVSRLLDLNVDRNETIIALGGGVIGDLAGFAASVTKRGVNFIQIPTTLLSQVDSSVGGKTGINTSHGKNFVGAFHQPRLVIADLGLLTTLPDRELLSGYAEIVKAALIDDAGLFDSLEKVGVQVFDSRALTQAIAAAVSFKARIVAEDEQERGRRALLNLGHTFGHAFEAEAPKDAIRHGEAVAAGMALAFEYSVHLGVCPASDAARVNAHLDAIGLPSAAGKLANTDWDTERLVARMRDDKKNQDGRITLILARGIGTAYIETNVDETDLVAFLETKLK